MYEHTHMYVWSKLLPVQAPLMVEIPKLHCANGKLFKRDWFVA